ncbi:hypothetical protein [Streptomyces sp. NPDC006879]|uniref:hypothetical protein n=1 Tax=Streptomyces sp. NPDC006879 TaxID=3364767 RepID=UPI003686B632
MKRPTRSAVFAALIASVAAGPALATSAAAAPAARCTVSAPDDRGRVSVTGQGFEPGKSAFLSSPSEPGGAFIVREQGSFTLGGLADGTYAVAQNNQVTRCSGGSGGVAQAPGEGTVKAGIVAGWYAVRDDCGARAPQSSTAPFSDGWDRGAAVARQAYC